MVWIQGRFIFTMQLLVLIQSLDFEGFWVSHVEGSFHGLVWSQVEDGQGLGEVGCVCGSGWFAGIVSPIVKAQALISLEFWFNMKWM